MEKWRKVKKKEQESAEAISGLKNIFVLAETNTETDTETETSVHIEMCNHTIIISNFENHY